MTSTVLVTGVSRYVGALFARELSHDPRVGRVIGIDLLEPRYPLGSAEFVRAYIGNPLVGKIIAQAGVDTVVHLSVSDQDVRDGSARVSQKERNVIGTMQLLAFCTARPSVRRVVLKSSASVYGSSPQDSAVFTEDMPAGAQIRAGHVRDVLEVEGYVRGVSRRRPDIVTCTLRMAHIVAAAIESNLTDFLRASVLPVPLGYDPRWQLLHPEDAIAALVAAATDANAQANGVVNVAGDGVLSLSTIARRLGRPVLPLPAATGRRLGSVARRLHLRSMSEDQMDYLMWGRCLDTTRMRTLLGVAPKWSTGAVVDEFARSLPESTPGGVPGLRDAARWVGSVGAGLRSCEPTGGSTGGLP
ncbi:MAG: NAD-dependent epimerase/dehydratase family protein [Micrococcales bacterium]|nr:NAD-dependent epimerase/dehydratase family protein [Micrococcales bacterium]